MWISLKPKQLLLFLYVPSLFKGAMFLKNYPKIPNAIGKHTKKTSPYTHLVQRYAISKLTPIVFVHCWQDLAFKETPLSHTPPG